MLLFIMAYGQGSVFEHEHRTSQLPKAMMRANVTHSAGCALKWALSFANLFSSSSFSSFNAAIILSRLVAMLDSSSLTLQSIVIECYTPSRSIDRPVTIGYQATHLCQHRLPDHFLLALLQGGRFVQNTIH